MESSDLWVSLEETKSEHTRWKVASMTEVLDKSDNQIYVKREYAPLYL